MIHLLRPGESARAITPHDTNKIPPTRALWIGTGGDLKVLFLNDTVAVTLQGVPAGVQLDYRVIQVFATGTTASDIIGID